MRRAEACEWVQGCKRVKGYESVACSDWSVSEMWSCRGETQTSRWSKLPPRTYLSSS